MALKNFRYQYVQTEVEVALLIISATAFVVLANPSNVTLQVHLLLQSSSNLSDQLSIVISFGTCCAGGTSHQKLSENLLRSPKLERANIAADAATLDTSCAIDHTGMSPFIIMTT